MARQPSDYCDMGKGHGYLGHFAKAKYLNRGHNDLDWPDLEYGYTTPPGEFMGPPQPDETQRPTNILKKKKPMMGGTADKPWNTGPGASEANWRG